MKKFLLSILLLSFAILQSCDYQPTENRTALEEQAKTEQNQKDLNAIQPAPKISWSLERDNLIKRFKLQNDKSVMFFMYVFIEGVADPVGYYQVNKVSSVNSQLTNTMQIVIGGQDIYTHNVPIPIPSPAEDGSYGTNGDAVFGFTPEEIYLEHNMKYIVSTVPLHFTKPVNRLTIISVETEKSLKLLMEKLNK